MSTQTLKALKADIADAKAHLKSLETALQLVQGPKRTPTQEVTTAEGEVVTARRGATGFTEAVRAAVAEKAGTASEVHAALTAAGRTETNKRTQVALWALVKRGEFKAIGTPRVFSLKKGKK